VPPVQYYETTVADTEGSPPYTFLSIPSRAIAKREDVGVSRVSDIARALRITESAWLGILLLSLGYNGARTDAGVDR
jgi:hypothetical protein